MKYFIIAVSFMFLSISLFSQRDVGMRGGLNLSNNLDYGQGAHVGWHLAAYKTFETYGDLAFRMEFKVQRIGCQLNDSKTAVEFYSNMPLLLDFRLDKIKFTSF